MSEVPMYGTSLGSSTECPKLGSYGGFLGTKPLGRLKYTLQKPTGYQKTDFEDFPNTHLATTPSKIWVTKDWQSPV